MLFITINIHIENDGLVWESQTMMKRECGKLKVKCCLSVLVLHTYIPRVKRERKKKVERQWIASYKLAKGKPATHISLYGEESVEMLFSSFERKKISLRTYVFIKSKVVVGCFENNFLLMNVFHHSLSVFILVSLPLSFSILKVTKCGGGSGGSYIRNVATHAIYTIQISGYIPLGWMNEMMILAEKLCSIKKYSNFSSTNNVVVVEFDFQSTHVEIDVYILTRYTTCSIRLQQHRKKHRKLNSFIRKWLVCLVDLVIWPKIDLADYFGSCEHIYLAYHDKIAFWNFSRLTHPPSIPLTP